MNKSLDVKFQNPDLNNSSQVVAFSGEFDKVGRADVAPELESLIKNFTLDSLIFDFSGLKFINSESIGYIIDMQSRLSKYGKKFVLIGADQHVKDVLNAVGISEIIPMYETLDEYFSKQK